MASPKPRDAMVPFHASSRFYYDLGPFRMIGVDECSKFGGRHDDGIGTLARRDLRADVATGAGAAEVDNSAKYP